MSNLIPALKSLTNMATLTYESEPVLLKGKVKEHPLLAGRKITKIQRVQVNPVRQYRRLKAKKLHISVTEVEVAARPDWTHISEGLVEDKNGHILFQASPVRELESAYFLDGVQAAPAEVEAIKECRRSRKDNPLVQLKTYRVDRIKQLNSQHQTVSGK